MSQSEEAPVAPEPAAATERIANDYYHDDDVVYRFGGDGGLEFGVVTEPGLEVGNVIVAWHPNDYDRSDVPESSVGLADRSIYPGGIVRQMVDGKEVRRGCCRDVEVVACLQVVGDSEGGTGSETDNDNVIRGVRSDSLEPLQSFPFPYTCCCLGSWIGAIKEVDLSMVLAFPDGSICDLLGANADELVNAHDMRDAEECNYCIYGNYKGEHLSGPVSVFRRGDWHKQTHGMSRMMVDPTMQNEVVTAIVVEVRTIAMRVTWQCCASAAASASGRPDSTIYEEDLKRVKLLNASEPSALQIGDRKFYRLRDQDVVVSMDEWKDMEKRWLSNEQDANPSLPCPDAAPEEKVPAKKSRVNSPESVVQTDGPMGRQNLAKKYLVVEVLSKRSVATVVWQNGDVSENVSSNDLEPTPLHDCREFFCGHFVVLASGSSTSSADPRVYGVVESVDGSARMCWVNWFRTLSSGEEPRVMGRTEEPVFDLVQHPDFSFRCDSLVIPVRDDEGDSRAVGGRVLDVRVTGKVVVRWADGSESSCWPQDIAIAKCDCSVYANDSWRKGSLHSVPEAINHLKGLFPYMSSATHGVQLALAGLEGAFSKNPHVDKEPMVSRLLDVHAQCLKLDSLMGANFFQAEGLQSLVEEVTKINQKTDEELAPYKFQVCAKLCVAIMDQLSRWQEEAVKRIADRPSVAEDLAAVAPTELLGEESAMPTEQNICEQSDGTSDSSNPPSSKVAQGTLSMLESAPSQHRFKHSSYQPTNPKNVVKFIRRDVKLMSENLPPGIHVKGYEDRMDLYSAMIEGPANTPYEDGMFFFDIQLSVDYPWSPPSFHYHSFTSDRLNPNLYADGKVCVSLLGTWDGEGSEAWTVGSNLLQVLVSIQGLILVSEPYFNEPGFEGQKGSQEGADNSKMYNEMVLLKVVQGMERLVGNPPVAFGSEVKAQIRQRSENIFERLESWGKASEGQDVRHPDFPLLPASRGFWISMDRAVESLKKALQTRDG